MKKILFSAAVIFSILNAGGNVELAPVEPVTPVQQPVAASGFYAGAAVSLVSAREAVTDLNFFDNEDGQDLVGNVTLLAGYNFNDYFAVEGRATTSVSQKDITKLTAFSLFLKPQYPVTSEINIYALLGYGHIKLDNYNGSNVDVSDSDFQWGLGASYDVTNNITVFVDYTSLGRDLSGTFLSSEEADVDSINVGVIYKF